MSNRFYEFGYDTFGRKIVINKEGEYVTHIPADLSPDEVLRRLSAGIPVNFDARNQGMQNCPAARVDESVGVGVAPRNEWPMYDAWDMIWRCDHNYACPFDGDQFKQAYLGNPEETMKIVCECVPLLAQYLDPTDKTSSELQQQSPGSRLRM